MKKVIGSVCLIWLFLGSVAVSADTICPTVEPVFDSQCNLVWPTASECFHAATIRCLKAQANQNSRLLSACVEAGTNLLDDNSSKDSKRKRRRAKRKKRRQS